MNYMKRGMLLFGAAALATSSLMAEEGAWRNVNAKYLQDPAYLPGWNGALTAVGDGVGEVYNGAFDLYQVISDAPAGDYTLTVTAFYRNGNTDTSFATTKDGANHNAYIYLGNASTAVKSQFDEALSADAIAAMREAVAAAEGTEWTIAEGDYGVVPNGLYTANVVFGMGAYLNTVTYNHAGGDLVLGIANKGGVSDEWCCFDNFKLVGPNGEVTVPNGDFAEGIDAKRAWDCDNIDGGSKTPDVNKHGGVYRKSNASPYNIGQRVTLPAGKYRFSVQSFLRHGNGNEAGKYVDIKDHWEVYEGESAFDRHNNGGEVEENNAYIYVTSGWDTDENGNIVKPVAEEYALDPEYGNPDGFYKQTAIKCIFDEELSEYPDNEPYNSADGDTANGIDGWEDSGCERHSAACFVNNPDLYRNYVEFELTEETPVYVGIKKDINAPSRYWNPWRDLKIEMLDNGAGVEGIADDANAPVEYYNLQGVRVANPSEGIFIVKKGSKATKQIFK